MNENMNDDFDFWKFLLDTFSSYDEAGDEKTKKEEPKKEVKSEKKEEEKEKKKEEPKNTSFKNSSLIATSDKPIDLDWLLKPGKHQPVKTEPAKNDACAVSVSKLWELHKSLSETVKRMNELTESMGSASSRWMKLNDGIYSCNSCGKYFTQEYNYCPNCGRKMYKALTNDKIFGA